MRGRLRLIKRYTKIRLYKMKVPRAQRREKGGFSKTKQEREELEKLTRLSFCLAPPRAQLFSIFVPLCYDDACVPYPGPPWADSKGFDCWGDCVRS